MQLLRMYRKQMWRFCFLGALLKPTSMGMQVQAEARSRAMFYLAMSLLYHLSLNAS